MERANIRPKVAAVLLILSLGLLIARPHTAAAEPLSNLSSASAPHARTILDKFNRSTDGIAHGITYVRALGGEGAQFSRTAGSYIQYPQGIPSQGTLEWWIKVDSGYSYHNFVLSRGQMRALIFTTDIAGGDVTWPGSAWLWVSANGKISFTLATSLGGHTPPDQVIAQGTSLRFGQWHSIGVSYGNQGEAIEVDGKLVAMEPGNTQRLGRGGNHYRPLDVPTIGESVSHFWAPHQYSGGFDGVVARFRASAAQDDWVLSAVNLPARTSARSAKSPACARAVDLGYSLTVDGQAYRVKKVNGTHGKQIPVFVDAQGRFVRDAALLRRLELAVWTRENIIASASTRAELAQKDVVLSDAVQTLQAMNHYQTVQDLLARSMTVALESTVTGGTSLPAGLAQVTAGELVHQLESDPHTLLTLTAEEGLLRSKALYDQLMRLLYPANATLMDADRLKRIYSLLMQAHTLELPNEALAAALSPEHASQLSQQALAIVVSQAISTLGPINPSATATLSLLLKTQQGLAEAAATIPVLKGYQTNMNLALALNRAYKRKISTWATESAAACGGTEAGSVPVTSGLKQTTQKLANIRKKVVGKWWSWDRKSYIEFLPTGACSEGYLYPGGKWHVEEGKLWVWPQGNSFICKSGALTLVGPNELTRDYGMGGAPEKYYRGIQNIPRIPTTLSVGAAQQILDQQINMTTVKNSLLTCVACYDPNDKEDNDKAPLISTVSGPLIPFLMQQGYIRANTEKHAANKLVFTGKAKRSRYYGRDGFRFANLRNPRILVAKIVNPRHVPIEYEFVPTELTMRLFGRVYRVKSFAVFSYGNDAWHVCIGCK